MSGIIDILISIFKIFFGSKKKKETENIKEEPLKNIPVKEIKNTEYIKEEIIKAPEPEKKEQTKLVYQTELKNPKLNKYGCAFRCYQAIAELTCNQFLNIEEIEKLGENAFNKEYLKGNAEVKKPEEIARDVLVYFGKDKDYKIYNSGYRKNGKAFDWSNKETDNYDYIITKLIQKNKKDNHFVLCGKNEKMIFDPTPNSISAQLWNVETEYLYKVKKIK